MSALAAEIAPIADGLDHVAVVSARAETLFASYERMGFTLTPWSRHSGAPAPGAAPVPWGTGNRCAMFRSGYLELLAIADQRLHCGPFPKLVDAYEGLHIIAFACGSATATAGRLSEAGVGVAGVVPLQREIGLEDGERTARFSLVRLEEGEAPEARLNFVEHHTPALLWQERYLDHPNGADSLNEVIVCVEDPDAAAARYRRLTGAAPARAGRKQRIPMGHGAISFIAAGDLSAELPGVSPPTLPFVAAFSVGTARWDEASRLLARNGLDAIAEKERLIVPPVQGCGATCIFERAS